MQIFSIPVPFLFQDPVRNLTLNLFNCLVIVLSQSVTVPQFFLPFMTLTLSVSTGFCSISLSLSLSPN